LSIRAIGTFLSLWFSFSPAAEFPEDADRVVVDVTLMLAAAERSELLVFARLVKTSLRG